MSEQPENQSSASPRPHRIPRIVQNWISLAGLVLAGSAVFAFVLLFAIDIFADHSNPYMGILAYVVAPFFFFSGVAMMLLGYWVQRRYRIKTRGEAVPLVLHIDFSKKGHQKLLITFAGVSAFFLLLTAFGSYQTYHMTETVSFCGEACHSMDPQNMAFSNSPHARVACVECHVGEGAGNYVRTKVNGVRQLYHTVLGDFPRPIQLHERSKRPSDETCRNCHWQEKHIGSKLKIYQHYLADEENLPWTIRMELNVGGGDPRQGPVEGIHWHTNLSNRVEFIEADPESGKIPWVRLTDANGEATVFRTGGFEGTPADSEIFVMDCMDCHNRPAHRLSSPNDAVDHAMANGRIDPSMPWAKMKSVEALSGKYANQDEAIAGIEAYLKSEYPEDERVNDLVAEVHSIYQKNFFPEMNADWRAYPELVGHKDWVGCFRCHDGEHVADGSGRSMKASDCTTCHTIVAQGSTPDELATTKPEGLPFNHIDFEYDSFDCADCHTGGNQEE
jgi:nitrate/TMAO reductase-like tetraheme cytochrome c subunit